jgi:hypothetical protein
MDRWCRRLLRLVYKAPMIPDFRTCFHHQHPSQQNKPTTRSFPFLTLQQLRPTKPNNPTPTISSAFKLHHNLRNGCHRFLRYQRPCQLRPLGLQQVSVIQPHTFHEPATDTDSQG